MCAYTSVLRLAIQREESHWSMSSRGSDAELSFHLVANAVFVCIQPLRSRRSVGGISRMGSSPLYLSLSGNHNSS